MRTRPPLGRMWNSLWGTTRARVYRNGRGGTNASTSTGALGEVPHGARSARGVRRHGRNGAMPAPLLGPQVELPVR